ncbi:DNA polymerase III subunit beta [Mycoplasma sp. 2704]|uniref:DNA polymerase III subunit beta n=1 Tax=unclassified Mycoplasma TaxID=2683645 RepID=UPI002B1DC8F1|nr:DNA polymerase III subunit beta [Mycoplasma sp. 2704]MEA4134649.1 DNA polymerase III subunit beta [Mycoplasma sp. 2704]
MKFTISKHLIDQLIEFISNYIDNNDMHYLSRTIKIELDSQNLVLTAANASIAARKVIKVDEDKIKVEKAGKLCILASLLKNIIKKFNKEITFKQRGNLIDIYEGSTSFTLTTNDITQYIDTNFEDQKNTLEIDAQRLDKIINNVSISTTISNDKLNSIVFKCINITSKNSENVRFVATDSYRLSTEILKVDKKVDIDLTVDAKSLKKLITKDAPEKVQLFFDEHKIGISYENTVIYISVSKIQYIDISSLFQTKYTRRFFIEKDELLKVINTALFQITEKDRKMEFSFNENEIKVLFEVPEIGTGKAVSNKFQILEGKPIDMDFNYIYIKDAVSQLEPGNINIFISEKEDRVLLLTENDNSHIQLITPLRKFYNN